MAYRLCNNISTPYKKTTDETMPVVFAFAQKAFLCQTHAGSVSNVGVKLNLYILLGKASIAKQFTNEGTYGVFLSN
ncbi:MAG: hypothetical protein FWE84_00580 [Firmicutes bacterium]|nr:hypothetical protein [Bacillota bacterium]